MAEGRRDPRIGDVADYLTERTGLDFGGARGRWLRDVGFGRGVDGGLGDRLLAGDVDAFASLCATATVQESYFFREPVSLEFLREKVLPDFVGRAGELRVWSAGCAGGEEAYTVAMMLAEAGLGHRAHVLGTDLSYAAIAKARNGVYKSWSLRGVDQDLLDRFFRPTDGGHEVLDRYRHRVDFAEHNLLAEPPSRAPFDLVLCRNVLIYFTPDAVRRVAAALVAALRPGGWLLTGVSDPVLEGIEDLTRLETSMGTAYRRPLPSEAAGATAPESVSSLRPMTREATPPGPARTPSRVVARTPTSRRPSPRQPSAPVPAPSPSMQWQAQAERALIMADPHEAESLARAALEQPADRAEAHSVLIRALAADGRLDEAADAGRRAVAELPVAADLRAVTSAVLIEAGRPQEARVSAREALYLDPDSPLAHLVLARAAEQMGDDVVAVKMRRNADRLLRKGASQ